MRRITLLAVAATALLGLASPASAVNISNGTVKLGLNPEGDLNATDPATGEFIGVTYVPTGNDGTRAACACEGWGAGANGPTPFVGIANRDSGNSNIQPVSFVTSASQDSAVSVVDILRGGTPAMRLTQDFHPAPTTPNLYEITTTVQNLTSDMLTNVRYERIMDWDIEPTAVPRVRDDQPRHEAARRPHLLRRQRLLGQQPVHVRGRGRRAD